MFFPVSGIECHPLVPVLAAIGISFVTSMGGLSGAFLLLPFQMSFLGYTSPGVSATNHLFNVLACPGGIVRYAREKNAQERSVTDFEMIEGQGIRATVDGVPCFAGNRRMLLANGLALSGSMQKLGDEFAAAGKTPLFFAANRQIVGIFAVADVLKPTSKAAVEALRSMHIDVTLLTGDIQKTAQSIASELGVTDVIAEVLPQDKERIVREKQGKGRKVAMIGDGINDAPALARADVGFAMAGNGTDTAIETADVALMDDDLRKIPRFIRLSRATFAILVQNITLALGVKALFFALTFTGHATMWMAVFADVGTALLVVANGLRAMRQ